MKTYMKFLLAFLLVLAFAGCGTPAAPTAVPPTAAPAPTVAAKPAFDLTATIDKYLTNLPDGWGTIAPAKLQEQIAAAKPFMVDVRETSEVEKDGYIDGVVNIPIRTLAQNLDKLPAKDQPIVVTCGSGHRSSIGMAMLQMLGYTNVKSMAGGLAAWKAANLPVSTGKPAAPTAGKAPDVDKDLLAAINKYLSGLPDGWGTIAPAKLQEQIAAAKPFMVDVRETSEVASGGKIAGTVSIPIRTLAQNLSKLPQDKTAPIVVICGSGHRSAFGMAMLQMLGYTNVKSMAGGMNAWKAANLPIEKAMN